MSHTDPYVIAMSRRNWHREFFYTGARRVADKSFNRDPRIIFIFTIILILQTVTYTRANPVPILEPVDPATLPEFNQSSSTVQSLLNNNASNSTTNDLYVIRAVVYEIGILTDVDNSTDETTEKHEEVNISFYDPPHNENGLLDLSGIPVPKVVAATN